MQKASAIGLEQIPRTTRAQAMDVLSSQAGILGYRAVIEAAAIGGKYFTAQTTAAGKVNPARVMVIGAGVAGLQSLGVARAMGAIVSAFDVRPEAKEQVDNTK